MQKTFFFHIPKCAGTSVWHALADIHGKDNIFQVRSSEEHKKFEEISDEKKSSYGAIGGHGRLSNLTKHAGDLSGYYKFTVLRHPVDRVISQYYFIRNRPTHHMYPVASEIPLVEYARRNINTQTKLLCDDADPEKARSVLDTFFDDWAFLDEVGELVSRLYSQFGLRPKRARHRNRAAAIHRQDPAVLEEIEALNSADMAFYDALMAERRPVPRPAATRADLFQRMLGRR